MAGKKIWILLLAWIVLSAIFGAILIPLNVPRILHIMRAEASAIGEVTTTDCQNHASVFYQFNFEGSLYKGRESMGAECATSKAGGKIKIYFAKDAPEINDAYAPQSDLINEIIPIVGVMLFFPPIIIWRTSGALKEWKDKKTGSTGEI